MAEVAAIAGQQAEQEAGQLVQELFQYLEQVQQDKLAAEETETAAQFKEQEASDREQERAAQYTEQYKTACLKTRTEEQQKNINALIQARHDEIINSLAETQSTGKTYQPQSNKITERLSRDIGRERNY